MELYFTTCTCTWVWLGPSKLIWLTVGRPNLDEEGREEYPLSDRPPSEGDSFGWSSWRDRGTELLLVDGHEHPISEGEVSLGSCCVAILTNDFIVKAYKHPYCIWCLFDIIVTGPRFFLPDFLFRLCLVLHRSCVRLILRRDYLSSSPMLIFVARIW